MDSSPASVLGVSCGVLLPPTPVNNVLVRSFSNFPIYVIPESLSKCALEISRSGEGPDALYCCSPAFPGDAKAGPGPTFEKQSPNHDSQMGGLGSAQIPPSRRAETAWLLKNSDLLGSLVTR